MSQLCRTHACHGCGASFDRRRFLHGCGVGAALAAAGTLWPQRAALAQNRDQAPVRVAAVFLCSLNTNEIWPYPNFERDARQQEVLAALRAGCPGVEFEPVTITNPADLSAAAALRDQVQGYFVYVMTLDWAQTQSVVTIGQFGKPLLVVDEFLGGSGAFLIACGSLAAQGIAAAAVSTTRLEDVVTVARTFNQLRNADVTPATFAQKCDDVYRSTFPARGDLRCQDDALQVADIGQCVERLRKSRVLIVGAGQAGTEQSFLGVTAHYADFDELDALYKVVDRDAAAEWANRWSKQAVELTPGKYVEPSRPVPEALEAAGGVYLATRELMKKYGTDSITMNCLGGFAAGKLPSYPCLGFMQILDEGGQGVCEAMPDDTVSMLMARVLTGRPGFVSDPALDTSTNQIVYAHCVGTTKVFGPAGAQNTFRIRTLHNRDPRGACAESFLPAGYMTTSFHTNIARNQLVVHQAKSLGTVETERGCRTKLVGEVKGDIGKLFRYWQQFGWHRVTVFGDVLEPVSELGRALGLEVIVEA